MYERIDWALLAKQKATLLGAINATSGENAVHLQGLLHLLDALQDDAAEQGFPVVWLGENP